MGTLRSDLIRLAAASTPEVRAAVLPLLRPKAASGLQPGDLRALHRELETHHGAIQDEMPADLLPAFYQAKREGLLKPGPRNTWIPSPEFLALLRKMFRNTTL